MDKSELLLFWIQEYNINKLATSEEIEEFELQKNVNKYNL